MCYSYPSDILLTGKSEDEHKPVFVTAHSPPKICQKLTGRETEIAQSPNMLHSLPRWHTLNIEKTHFCCCKILFYTSGLFSTGGS